MQPNGTKCTKTSVKGQMGWILCARSEKFWRDFMARTFALVRPFCLSFVRQPNGTECTQMVRNAPKHQFWVKWGGSGDFIAENSDASSWHKFLHKFGTFCPEFRKATKWSRMDPNSTKCTKCQFRVRRGGSGAFVVKNSEATSFPNFCTSSARFAPSFVRQPNGPECT